MKALAWIAGASLLLMAAPVGATRDLVPSTNSVYPSRYEEQDQLRGKPVPLKLTAAKADTVYLMGGDLVPHQGDFEDESGNPSLDGWTSVDCTSAIYWHTDTYNCANLDPTTPGNHAWWCGRYWSFDCGTGDYAGYGNAWEQVLDWFGTVPDNSLSTTVRITAMLNYDVELDYDYLYLDYETSTGMNLLQEFNGDSTSVFVDQAFVLAPGDYVGSGSDQVHLRWRFESDFYWSDEDCNYPTMGAAQIDLIEITFDQGGGPVQQSYEDCEGTTTDWSVDLNFGVGDFAQVWPFLTDIDPCRSNSTPVVGFIDDGLVVPGTGGYLCTTWCYGPGGYIVNPEGGLAGPEDHIWNEIWSPILDWPGAGYDAAIYEFDVYRHETLSLTAPGVFYVWHVRSVETGNPADMAGAAWYDRGFVYYGGPDWIRTSADVTDLLIPGRTHVQLALGVYELGWLWGWDGTDGYPAPYFDNVAFKTLEFAGPAVATRELELAQDSFPAIGAYDYGDPVANSVRFDRASGPAWDWGDSLTASIVPVRTGSALNDMPKLYYKLNPNPLFDPVRTHPVTGWVYGDSARWGDVVNVDRFSFDLPDSGFLFPGDVIHYYLEAQDNQGGDIGTTLLPSDTTGFGDFGSRQYDSSYIMRALPSFNNLAQGDHPAILFWNDFGGRGGEDEWGFALENLGYQVGRDYDLYYTNAPSSGVGNGLGSLATATQLNGYETILYTSGDLYVMTICNGDEDNDPSDDVGVLESWLQQGNKNMFLTGDNLAFDLWQSGTATLTFLNSRIGVNFIVPDLIPMIDSQVAPVVRAVPGNSVFQNADIQEWIAYGGCPGINELDAVEVMGATERLAEFTDPHCNSGQYPFAAATLNHDATYNNEVVYLPYDLMFVYTGGCGDKRDSAPLAARTLLLQEVLFYFGHIGSSPTTDVPVPDHFAVQCYPNPFNPRLKVAYHMPRRGELTVKIYSLRGELVRTLIDEPVAAGDGFVPWDGTDGSGREVASGVYFTETRALGETHVQKISLVR